MSYRKWFTSRDLRAILYQIKSLEEIENIFGQRGKKTPVVMAFAPGGGKTLTATAFIDTYLQRFPRARVLVLSHAQTLLRDQFSEVLEKHDPDFTRTTVVVGKDIQKATEQVVISLPQPIYKLKKLPHFDLVVIDEAHQYYAARNKKGKPGMVQQIINKVNPRHKLLLTGTPAIFVLKKYPIVAVSVNEMAEQKMVADLMVELASSTYDLKLRDFTQNFEVKDSFKFKPKDTEASLDIVLGKVVERLRSLMGKRSKLYGTVKNVTGWSAVFKIIKKTLIACNNQKQARQVQRYFVKRGVNVAISISEDGRELSEFDRFRDDKNCPLLIVVRRGILGFNMPELENVIDMTCSQNPNTIFQLFCRVIRPHPKRKKKLFFKVVPHHLETYFEHVMTATLCLTDKRYFTLFNGKNFLDLDIPVFEPYKNGGGSVEADPDAPSGSKKKRRKKYKSYKGLPVVAFFQHLLHKNKDSLALYAWTTLRQVRNDMSVCYHFWTKEECKENALKYKTRTEWHNNESGAIHYAKRNGYYEECCAHMPRLRGSWSLAECKEIAAKYQQRNEWEREEGGSARYARDAGWMEKCCGHMKVRSKTFAECMASALRFHSTKEWIEDDVSSYGYAWRRGWLDKCRKHMSPLRPEKTRGVRRSPVII